MTFEKNQIDGWKMKQNTMKSTIIIKYHEAERNKTIGGGGRGTRGREEDIATHRLDDHRGPIPALLLCARGRRAMRRRASSGDSVWATPPRRDTACSTLVGGAAHQPAFEHFLSASLTSAVTAASLSRAWCSPRARYVCPPPLPFYNEWPLSTHDQSTRLPDHSW